MKHEKEIDQILKDILFKDWMDDEDYKEVIDITFKAMGITKQKLCDDLEIGIKNGYSLEQQLNILKQVLKIGN